MSRSLTLFLAFAVGSLTGFGISYYILRDHFDNELFEEVSKVKEECRKESVKEPEALKAEEKEENEENVSDDKIYNDIVKKQVTHYENYARKYRTKTKSKPAVDMDKLTKKDMLDMYVDGLEEEDFDEDSDDLAVEEDDIFPYEKRPEPYSVDPQGGTAAYSTYERITLIWYSKDDILVFEDSDEEFIHPEDYIGEKWRKCVGQFEPDMAYIRNDNTETDYEIVREDRRYSAD